MVWQILDDLLPHEQSMWADIENILQRQFGRHVLLDVRAQLVNQQRCDGEKLGAFAADLCQLALQGYPDFLSAIQEELMLQTFLRRLQLERLCKHV